MLANGERKDRNSKLENFLRRKLKPSVYGDIRWYEPVVVRKDGGLAYKQVVVTGEEILMVDTPPKDIHTLVSINAITAVLLVHDLPEFLEGGLRDRTTHVLLKVKNESSLRNGNSKLRRTSITSIKLPSSRRGSLQHALSEESTAKGSPGRDDDHLDSSKKAIWKKSLERRSSREILSFSSIDLETLKNLSKQGSGKVTPATRFRPPFIRGFTIGEDVDHKARSVPSFKMASSTTDSGHSLSMGEVISEGCVEGGLSPMFGVKGEFGARPISPALFDVLNRVDAKYVPPNGRSITPDLTSSHQAIPRSLSAFEHYRSSSVCTALRSRSVLDKPLNLYSGTFPRRSQSSSNLNMSEIFEEDEIHLYTLSTSTHLFHLLHSLWMASLLLPFEEISELTALNTCLQLNQEGIDQTFRSLCSDLQEASSIEEHYSLIQDLLQGIKKYSNVRRAFWRDTEALFLVRELLRVYSNKSFDELVDQETYFEQRENELKIVVLALQIIEHSLRHSQGCPFKAKTLNNKTLLEELLKEIFSVPEILPPHNMMCKRFLSNYKQLSEGAWQYLPEKELLESVQKTIDASVGTAFQLIEAIFEFGWSDLYQGKSKTRKKDNQTMALNILLQYVSVDEWLSYAMPKLLLLVQPKSKDCEETAMREDQILIYQYLAVLLALLKQSPKALAFCISNYSEELRYYVNESVLKRKMDALDPLTPHTFRLAKSILKMILR